MKNLVSILLTLVMSVTLTGSPIYGASVVETKEAILIGSNIPWSLQMSEATQNEYGQQILLGWLPDSSAVLLYNNLSQNSPNFSQPGDSCSGYINKMEITPPFRVTKFLDVCTYADGKSTWQSISIHPGTNNMIFKQCNADCSEIDIYLTNLSDLANPINLTSSTSERPESIHWVNENEVVAKLFDADSGSSRIALLNINDRSIEPIPFDKEVIHLAHFNIQRQELLVVFSNNNSDAQIGLLKLSDLSFRDLTSSRFSTASGAEFTPNPDIFRIMGIPKDGTDLWHSYFLNTGGGALSPVIPIKYTGAWNMASPDNQWLMFSSPYGRDSDWGQLWLYPTNNNPTKLESPEIGVSINDGSLYTNKVANEINILPPPGVSQILVSNDGGFKDAKRYNVSVDSPWDPLQIAWKITSYGAEKLPRSVYVRFVGEGKVASDDIILDRTAPNLTSLSATASSRQLLNPSRLKAFSNPSFSPSSQRSKSVRIQVNAVDKTSGVAKIQYFTTSQKKSTLTKYAKTIQVAVPANAKSISVRVSDRAGNWTKWRKTTIR
jgi:hypothetical protein